MNKSLFFFLLALVVLVGVGCGTQKNTTKSSSASSATPVYLEEKLLNALDHTGLANIRFNFETELVLTLAEDIPGNGKPVVDEKEGNVVVTSAKTVRFSPNTLGKFISPSQGSKTFKASWDESDVMGLSLTYDENRKLIVEAADLNNGKPITIYQGVTYYLPQNYKTCFLKVGKVGKGETETAPGVSRPNGQRK